MTNFKASLLCNTSMWIQSLSYLEHLVLLITATSPIIMITLISLGLLHTDSSETIASNWQSCRIQCEATLISFCTRLLLFYTMLLWIYGSRIRRLVSWGKHSTHRGGDNLLVRRQPTPIHDLLYTPIYVVLDSLLSAVTLAYWVIVWRHEMGVVNSLSDTESFVTTTIKPLTRILKPRSISNNEMIQNEEHHLTNSLLQVIQLVEVNLVIQLGAIICLNLCDLVKMDSSQSFVIRVQRSPDAICRSYVVKLNNIASAAIDVIQSMTLESHLNDPLVVRAKKRAKRSNSIELPSDNKPFSRAPPATGSTKTPSGKAVSLCDAQSSQNRSDYSTSTSRAAMHRRLTKRYRQETASSFKLYSVDSDQQKTTQSQRLNQALQSIDQRQLDESAAERFSVQSEFDLLVRKRQLRLTMLASRLFGEYGVGQGNSNYSRERVDSASHQIFRELSGPMTKYLRFTGQQDAYSYHDLFERLKLCLTYSISPEAFLAVFFGSAPALIIDDSPEHSTRTQWLCTRISSTDSLHSKGQAYRCMPGLRQTTVQRQDNLLTQDLDQWQSWQLTLHDTSADKLIHHGLKFELIRGSVTLCCTVYQRPVIQLSQERVKEWTVGGNDCKTLRILPKISRNHLSKIDNEFSEVRL